MDTVTHYKAIVRDVLQVYADAKNSDYQIESETIFLDSCEFRSANSFLR